MVTKTTIQISSPQVILPYGYILAGTFLLKTIYVKYNPIKLGLVPRVKIGKPVRRFLVIYYR